MTSFLSSPGCSHPGLSWLPLMGFQLCRSGRLVASGSSKLVATQSFHSVLSLRHILAFCAMRVGVPPVFPRSWRRSLASCLAALPFASLPLVSRPWTALSGSHLVSLSSVSDQLVGLGGCSPTSPNCPPSRIRKQRPFGFSASLSLRVFAMRSPLRVEYFSDLDRSEDSLGIFPRVWCQAFTMRSPFRVESVSVLDRNDGSYYTFLVFGRSLRDEVTLTGRVFFRS